MADVDFDDFDGAHHGGWQGVAAGQGGLSRIVHLAGAACSIALVVGLGWWGYKLAVRDVTGIPVVRALEGPMRVAPENPGGTIADHQGLAVNSVAAIGTAAPPPDRLVLAPRPVELTYEDTPGLAAAGTSAPQTQVIAASAAIQPPAASGPAPLVDATVAPAPQDQNTGPDPDAVAQALAEALAAPLDDSTAEAMAASAEPAGTLSQRPRARPSSLAGGAPAPAAVETVSLADPASSTPVALSEVDPAMIPAGTRLVQLGAFDSADQARAEWVKLANVFGPVLDGKALVVQAAESGGRTFFRLRAHGFADEAEARGFCTTLLEQNTSCIPVEHR